MSGIDAAGLGAPAALALAGAIFLVAGAVKGVVGLGLPTISMALLALLMPPAQAAALLIVPSLVTNLWQAGPLASLRRVWRRIAGMQAGVCVGTLGGAWWFGAPAGAWAAGALGAALLAYAGWGLLGRPPRVPARAQAWLGPAVGALTGLVTAATGVFVVPAVPYLQALGLDKDELVQAMGISFSVSTLALAAGLGLTGHYGGGAAAISLAMLAPALAGMVCGQRLRHALSPQRFRLCLYASLALLGAYQLVQAR